MGGGQSQSQSYSQPKGNWEAEPESELQLQPDEREPPSSQHGTSCIRIATRSCPFCWLADPPLCSIAPAAATSAAAPPAFPLRQGTLPRHSAPGCQRPRRWRTAWLSSTAAPPLLMQPNDPEMAPPCRCPSPVDAPPLSMQPTVPGTAVSAATATAAACAVVAATPLSAAMAAAHAASAQAAAAEAAPPGGLAPRAVDLSTTLPQPPARRADTRRRCRVSLALQTHPPARRHPHSPHGSPRGALAPSAPRRGHGCGCCRPPRRPPRREPSACACGVRLLRAQGLRPPLLRRRVWGRCTPPPARVPLPTSKNEQSVKRSENAQLVGNEQKRTVGKRWQQQRCKALRQQERGRGVYRNMGRVEEAGGEVDAKHLGSRSVEEEYMGLWGGWRGQVGKSMQGTKAAKRTGAVLGAPPSAWTRRRPRPAAANRAAGPTVQLAGPTGQLASRTKQLASPTEQLAGPTEQPTLPCSPGGLFCLKWHPNLKARPARGAPLLERHFHLNDTPPPCGAPLLERHFHLNDNPPPRGAPLLERHFHLNDTPPPRGAPLLDRHFHLNDTPPPRGALPPGGTPHQKPSCTPHMKVFHTSLTHHVRHASSWHTYHLPAGDVGTCPHVQCVNPSTPGMFISPHTCNVCICSNLRCSHPSTPATFAPDCTYAKCASVRASDALAWAGRALHTTQDFPHIHTRTCQRCLAWQGALSTPRKTSHTSTPVHMPWQVRWRGAPPAAPADVPPAQQPWPRVQSPRGCTQPPAQTRPSAAAAAAASAATAADAASAATAAAAASAATAAAAASAALTAAAAVAATAAAAASAALTAAAAVAAQH
eukprot:358891-Chlamydomonas_euryale.AAC.4